MQFQIARGGRLLGYIGPLRYAPTHLGVMSCTSIIIIIIEPSKNLLELGIFISKSILHLIRCETIG